MECSERRKKVLLYLTEKMMSESGIEIRDTWRGHQNESVEVQKTPGNGPCFFVAEKEELPGFKSLSYTNPIIVLPELYGGTLHQVIHEAVHLLQHNDWKMDKEYFKTKKFDRTGFKEFVSQRQETEAHFIQLLFIARYEHHLIKPRELNQFRNRLFKAISRPAIRVSAICWGVFTGLNI